jgi:hypothetical protein
MVGGMLEGGKDHMWREEFAEEWKSVEKIRNGGEKRNNV